MMMGSVCVAYLTKSTKEPAPGSIPLSLGILVSGLVPIKVAPFWIASTAIQNFSYVTSVSSPTTT